MLGSSAPEQEIAKRAAARGVHEPLLEELLGVEAMADRDYPTAEKHLARAQAGSHDADRMLRLRVFALCLAGERARAAALSLTLPQPRTPRDEQDWRWLSEACGLSARASP
jgi:hypothetical protein